jgi:hypothetical protein
MVAREPPDGDLPLDAQAMGATYFIEVFIAADFLEDWIASERRPISARERCERLIEYAIRDA